MLDWLAPGDVIVVDRGFRDTLDDLNRFGYETRMPKFLGKHQKQFTTIEANETRLITKIKWKIESTLGRVKQWRFFNNVVPRTMIEKIGDYFRIICAMINCYRPVLITNSVNDPEIGEKLLKLLHQPNKLKDYVQQLKDTTGKNLKWFSLNTTKFFPTFPKMEFKELQELALGIYQLKQARACTAEYLSSEDTYIVKVANQTPDLLRSQIKGETTYSRTLWTPCTLTGLCGL